MTLPYVYKFTHLPTNMYYIGSRWKTGCHPDEPITSYASSSKIVKKMILSKPEEWSKSIIATGTKEEVYKLETDILRLFDAKNDKRSFNQHNNTLKHFDKTGIKESEYTRKKKAESHTGKKRPEHSEAMKEHFKSSADHWFKNNRPESPGAKQYKVYYPDGSSEVVKNLEQFAKLKGWPMGTYKEVVKGLYIPKRGKMIGIRIMPYE